MNNLTLNSNVYNRDYRFVPTQSAPASVQMRAAAPQQDEFSTATTAVGAAGLLRLAQYGLEKLSGVCSAALMAGKEFASREDVEKVANAMKKNKGLSADIYYLDHSNTSALKQHFPSLANSIDGFIIAATFLEKYSLLVICLLFSSISTLFLYLGYKLEYQKKNTYISALIYFSVGEHKACAKIDASREVGKTIEIGINKADLHYFSRDTLKRL